jgi:hypothetical protein
MSLPKALVMVNLSLLQKYCNIMGITLPSSLAAGRELLFAWLDDNFLNG